MGVELDVDGHTLTGFINAVYRTPDDELLVIDYRPTERHRDLDDDKQLPIYLLACRDRYDEPVTRAGYAHAGPIGPTVETRVFPEAELNSVRLTITGTMDRIVDTSFQEFEMGEHCQ